MALRQCNAFSLCLDLNICHKISDAHTERTQSMKHTGSLKYGSSDFQSFTAYQHSFDEEIFVLYFNAVGVTIMAYMRVILEKRSIFMRPPWLGKYFKKRRFSIWPKLKGEWNEKWRQWISLHSPTKWMRACIVVCVRLSFKTALFNIVLDERVQRYYAKHLTNWLDVCASTIELTGVNHTTKACHLSIDQLMDGKFGQLCPRKLHRRAY